MGLYHIQMHQPDTRLDLIEAAVQISRCLPYTAPAHAPQLWFCTAPAHDPAPAHENGSSFYDFFPVGESRLYWYDLCPLISLPVGWSISSSLYTYITTLTPDLVTYTEKQDSGKCKKKEVNLTYLAGFAALLFLIFLLFLRFLSIWRVPHVIPTPEMKKILNLLQNVFQTRPFPAL